MLPTSTPSSSSNWWRQGVLRTHSSSSSSNGRQQWMLPTRSSSNQRQQRVLSTSQATATAEGGWVLPSS